MDKKINLSQLTDLFCNVSNLGKGVSTTFVKTFFETIINEVSSGEQVRIKGFGLFKQVVINDRESIDVNTGERIVIHGHQKVSFTPDPELKEFINKPFDGFETVLLDNTEDQVVLPPAKKTASRKKSTTDNRKAVSVENAATETPIIVQHEIKAATNDNSSDVVEMRRIMRWLRILLIAIIVLLAVLVVSYCIWPLNLAHHMRTGMESVEQVTSDGGNQNASPADTVRYHDAASVPENKDEVSTSQVKDEPEAITDDKSQSQPKEQLEVKPEAQGKKQPQEQKKDQPKPQPKSEPKVQPKQENKSVDVQPSVHNDATPASSVSKSEFALTTADNDKPLDQFTIRDTTSYRMTNVIITTHVLKSGETLTKVSEKYYGTKKLWPYIAAYNNITDVNSASVGTKLKIPILVNK